MVSWFSSIPTALDDVVQNVKFQHATIAAEARYYKTKCRRLQSVLERVKHEHDGYKELQRAHESLQREVSNLRSQLAQANMVGGNAKKRRVDSGSDSTAVTDLTFNSSQFAYAPPEPVAPVPKNTALFNTNGDMQASMMDSSRSQQSMPPPPVPSRRPFRPAINTTPMKAPDRTAQYDSPANSGPRPAGGFRSFMANHDKGAAARHPFTPIQPARDISTSFSRQTFDAPESTVMPPSHGMGNRVGNGVIVLALAIWARPPDVNFNGIQFPTDASAVQVQANSLDINLQISVGVKNPNFFGATFSSITAKAFYPPLTSQLGGGQLWNVKFPANSNTQFLFPFNITYSTSLDPNNILIKDLVDKCGIKPGSAKQQLTVKYDLTLALRIVVVTIRPSFSGTANFDCPVTKADLMQLGGADLLKSLGIDPTS
ncbi:hypothetical protein FRB99_006021 [Tulasnella sp. 403]|nr:hypothetical protein FRB99_006021 [Tulasnella sp. 403]